MKRIVAGTILLMGIICLSKYLWTPTLIVSENFGDSKYVGDCQWYNLDDYGPRLLNLSAATGWEFVWSSDTNACHTDLSYSICRNDDLCRPQSEQGILAAGGSGESCTMLAQFNDSNYGNPIWVNETGGYLNITGYWTIKYHTPATDTIINWYCNPYIDGPLAGNATCWSIPGTHYWSIDLNMYSSAVCYNVSTTTTTTTAVPGGDCFWNIGNNILNLTSYKNQTIATLETNNTDIIAAITPCENGLQCGNERVMSYEYDFVNDKCDNFLAIWEEGINEPIYDPNNREWQFIYTNGEKCDGNLENIYSVYWLCDYETNNQAKVVYFKQTGICSYEMHVNS